MNIKWEKMMVHFSCALKIGETLIVTCFNVLTSRIIGVDGELEINGQKIHVQEHLKKETLQIMPPKILNTFLL